MEGIREGEKEQISVLMAVYNTEPAFLGEAVSSILKQTYKNIELVIINDGSTDPSTLEKLYSFQDQRIRIIENERNMGLTESLIKGVRECRGRYIARLDADDVSAPERLEKQLAYLKKSGFHIIGSNYSRIPSLRFHRLVTDQLLSLKMRLIFGNAAIMHSTAFWEREYLSKKGVGYDSQFSRSQDYGLWCDCAANGIMIGTHPDQLVQWRESESQISKKYSSQQDACKKKIRKKYISENFIISDAELHFFVNYMDDAVFRQNKKVIKKAQAVLRRFLAQNKDSGDFSSKEVYLYWMIQAVTRLKNEKKCDMIFCRFFLKVLSPVNLVYIINTIRKELVTSS